MDAWKIVGNNTYKRGYGYKGTPKLLATPILVIHSLVAMRIRNLKFMAKAIDAVAFLGVKCYDRIGLVAFSMCVTFYTRACICHQR